MVEYGRQEYWNDRYERERETFEWYQNFETLRPLLERAICKTSRVLVVGCGSSALSADIHANLAPDVTSIDYSLVVINQMQQKHTANPELKFFAMDATHMSFQKGTFDVIVDKGTLDSILCGENYKTSSHELLREISRVLCPGGMYVLISYGSPTTRDVYLRKPNIYNWDVNHTHEIPKPNIDSLKLTPTPIEVHFYYEMKKSDDSHAVQARGEPNETEVHTIPTASSELAEFSDAELFVETTEEPVED